MSTEETIVILMNPADTLLALLDSTFASDDAVMADELDALEAACVAKVEARNEYVREAIKCGLMTSEGRYSFLPLNKRLGRLA